MKSFLNDKPNKDTVLWIGNMILDCTEHFINISLVMHSARKRSFYEAIMKESS